MGIYQKCGESELFYIYQKFIRFCLPESNNILFYSSKRSGQVKEKCAIKLTTNGVETEYILNHDTKLFEEREKEQEKIKKKTIPVFSEGDER